MAPGAQFDEAVLDLTSGPIIVAIFTHIENYAISRISTFLNSFSTPPFLFSSGSDAAEDDLRFFFYVQDEAKASSPLVSTQQPALGYESGVPGQHFPLESTVRDFIFRRSIGIGGGLTGKSMVSTTPATLDRAAGGILSADVSTLQELISRGLVEMCKIKPQGDDAVLWLADWLDKNNPAGPNIQPPAPILEASPAALYAQELAQKSNLLMANNAAINGTRLVSPHNGPVVTLNVDDEAEGEKTYIVSPNGVRPFVVFALGGPGSGSTTVCSKLAEELGYVHLEAAGLLRREFMSGSKLGKQLEEYFKTETPAPPAITIQLLAREMKSHCKLGQTRFLIDGWPRDVVQLSEFDKTICAARFVLYLKAKETTLCSRIELRARLLGRVDDKNPSNVLSRIRDFGEKSAGVLDVLAKDGRLRIVDADPENCSSAQESIDKVVAEAKNIICPQVFVLLGGGPLALRVAQNLMNSRRIPYVDVAALIQKLSRADPEVARIMRRGKQAPSSLISPLVVEEIRKTLALGHNTVTVIGFPQCVPQLDHMKKALHCNLRGLKIDVNRHTLKSILLRDLQKSHSTPVKGQTESLAQLERRARNYYAPAQKAVEQQLSKDGSLEVIDADRLYNHRSLLTGRNEAVHELITAAALKVLTPRTIIIGARSEHALQLAISSGRELAVARGRDSLFISVPDLISDLYNSASVSSQLVADIKEEMANYGKTSFMTELRALNSICIDTEVKEIIIAGLGVSDTEQYGSSLAFNHDDQRPSLIVDGYFGGEVEKFFLVQTPDEAKESDLDQADLQFEGFNAELASFYRKRGKSEVIQLSSDATNTASDAGSTPGIELAAQMNNALAPQLVFLAAPPGFNIDKLTKSLADSLGIVSIPTPEKLLLEAISEHPEGSNEHNKYKAALETLRTAPTPGEPIEVPPPADDEEGDEAPEPEEPIPTVHVPVDVIINLTAQAVKRVISFNFKTGGMGARVNRSVVLCPGQPISVEHIDAIEASNERAAQLMNSASQGFSDNEAALGGPSLKIGSILHFDASEDEKLQEFAASIGGEDFDAGLFDQHLQGWRQTKKILLARLTKLASSNGCNNISVHVISADDRKLPEEFEEMDPEEMDPKRAFKPFPKGWDLALNLARKALLPEVFILMAPEFSGVSRIGAEFISAGTPGILSTSKLASLPILEAVEFARADRAVSAPIAPGYAKREIVDLDVSVRLGQEMFNPATNFYPYCLVDFSNSPTTFKSTLVSPSAAAAALSSTSTTTLAQPNLGLLSKVLENFMTENLLGTVLLEGFPFACPDLLVPTPSARDQLIAIESVARIAGIVRLDVDADGLAEIHPAFQSLAASQTAPDPKQFDDEFEFAQAVESFEEKHIAFQQLYDSAKKSIVIHEQLVASMETMRRDFITPTTHILSSASAPIASGNGCAIRAQPAGDLRSLRSACEQLAEKIAGAVPKLLATPCMGQSANLNNGLSKYGMHQ